MTESEEFRERIGRIDGLVQEIDRIADPAVRANAKELMQCVMDLHRAGFERTLEILSNAGEPGARLIQNLGKDDLISSLLVLYDLHPEDFDTRLNRGIEKGRQRLTKRGASVDVHAVDDRVVRLKIHAGGHSCGSTTQELESIVREAVFATAPDAFEVIFEGEQEQPASGFVPLTSLQGSNGSTKAGSALSR
ncbi:MAG: NifU family protein [Acidobacteriaceae bacterium]|nr:NifU family protein [Acidobacteriaceae bacterium]MBV9297067.1 NifU family protein [Acidobacteriaceae bacterium]MBV9763349.1 NifU family protein [Acidobacteriaceae bacterium]